MKTPPIGSLWRRVIMAALIHLAISLSSGRAQSTVTFELPLGRFSHGFTLHYLDSNSNENTVSSPVSALAPAASVDGSGNYVLAADSHLEITFQADSSQVSQWWLSDDSVSAFSQPGAFDLRGLPWAQTPGAGAALSAGAELRRLGRPPPARPRGRV